MKGYISKILLVLGILSFNFFIDAANYYEILRLPRHATRDDIRKNCDGVGIIQRKQAEIEAKVKEWGDRVREELADASKGHAASKKADEDLTKLRQELDKLIRSTRMEGLKKLSSDQIKNICVTLRDPIQRSKYDSTLPAEGIEQEIIDPFKGKTHYQILDLTRDATVNEIQQKCDRQKREIETELRKQLQALGLTTANKAQLQELSRKSASMAQQVRTFEVLELKRDKTNIACDTLSDAQKKEAYNEQLKAEGTKEFGAIRGILSEMQRDSDKLIGDIVGDFLTEIPIPDVGTKLFNQNLAIRNISFVKAPFGVDVRTGIGFTGTMYFNNIAVQATMFVVIDTNRKKQYSLAIALPDHYKISSMFPQFRKLDELSLPKAKFVVSSFDYYDPDGHSIKKGFNFISQLELKGPLKILNDLKDKAKSLKSIVVRAEPILFQGVIPKNIQKAEFSAKLPIYFGINFTKIPRMPKMIKSVFNELTTDDLELALTVYPKVSFTIETGVRLVLGTQKESIRLSGLGIIEPTSFSLGMRMRNMLQLRWLALGNAGIQLDWDEGLMPVAAMLGIPFTGIGVNGQVDVGKEGDSRAVFNMSGGARVSSSGFPDLVFDVDAQNIRFADLIRLFIKTATKVKIAPDVIQKSRLPAMSIERVRGFLALEDTKIAGKIYEAGFALDVEAHFFNRRAGFSFDLKHTAARVSGSGYVSNIDFNIKGKPIFKLTGRPFTTRSGKQVEGPAVDFYFGLKEPDRKQDAQQQAREQFIAGLEGHFGVKGILEVPAIDLRQAVDLEWTGWNLRADFESEMAGFSVLFGVSINLKAGVENLSDYELLKREVQTLFEGKKQNDVYVTKAKALMEQLPQLEAKKQYSKAIAILNSVRDLLKEVSTAVQAFFEWRSRASQHLVMVDQLLIEAKILLFGGEKDTRIYPEQMSLEAKEKRKQKYNELFNKAKKHKDWAKERFKQLESIETGVEKIKQKLQRKEEAFSKALVPVIPGYREIGDIDEENLNKVAMARAVQGYKEIVNRLEAAKKMLESIIPASILAEKLAPFMLKEEREMDPSKKWREMYIRFGFRGDFDKFLSEKARPGIEALKKQSAEKLTKLNADIGEFSKKVEQLGTKGENATQEEIKTTRQIITSTRKKIEMLKKERSETKNLVRRASITAEIAGIQTALKIQQVYLDGLLVPSKKVVRGASKAIASATKALHKAQLLKRAAETTLNGLSKALNAAEQGFRIFHVTEAQGEFTSADIMSGKLPRLISLVAEINIPGVTSVSVNLHNVQFDFKRPGYSATKIAEQLLQGVKLGDMGI